MSDYFVEQVAAVRRELAALRQERVTYRSATVTDVDAPTSTFTGDVDGVGGLPGIPAPPGSLPAVGDIVSLSLAGATPVYQPSQRSTVDPASGRQSSNVTESGIASFQRVDSAEDPIVLGLPLVGYHIAQNRGRLVGYGKATVNAYTGIGFGELGTIEVAFTAEGGRAYAISFEGLNVAGNTAGDDVALRVRNAGASTPQVTSPLQVGPIYDQITAINRYHDFSFFRFLMGVPEGIPSSLQRLLVTVSRGAGGTGALEVVQCEPQIMVLDVGPNVQNTGVANLGGAPAPGGVPAVQRREILTDANWSATYNGGGGLDSEPEIIQGYTSYYTPRGNAKGLIGFPDVTGLLAGVTDDRIERIELSLYANHWYYNSGGNGIFGYHSNTSRPGSFVNASTGQWSWNNWGRNQRIVMDITNNSGLKAALRSGAVRGFTVGPGTTTDPIYYGRFNGASMAEPPRLRIVYYQ